MTDSVSDTYNFSSSCLTLSAVSWSFPVPARCSTAVYDRDALRSSEGASRAEGQLARNAALRSLDRTHSMQLFSSGTERKIPSATLGGRGL